jgi:hypothetical protein
VATSRARAMIVRAARLLGLALAVVVGFVALAVLPLFAWLIPETFRRHPVEWSALALLGAYGLARRSDAARARRVVARLDDLAGRALAGGLSRALAVAGAVMLASWAPHYLTWPWFRDLDTFAVIAQSWDAGVRPYRDITGYNFPGQTYLHWAIGKAVGWGHTPAFYAADVAFLLALGLVLVAWSRRRLGGPLPGLVAYLAFLHYYLGLEYSQVAQRDWQAACLVALGLLASQAWPGRAGRLAAASATGFALAFRPHVVLFLPAMVSAIDEGERRPEEPWSRAAPGVAEWALAFALCAALAFAPLVLGGIFEDFVRGLRVAAYGGPYSRATSRGMLRAWGQGLRAEWGGAGLAACLLLWVVGPPEGRRRARTWALALLGASAYKPVHPVQHTYLGHPLALVGAVAAALVVERVLTARLLDRPVKLLVIALILYEVMPEVPRFCLPLDSLKAIGPLARGEEPVEPPPGSYEWFPRVPGESRNYRWDHYRATLAYLRRATRPTTLVANVLRRYPFPAVNGPTGRLSPFRAESGICWMWLVDLDLDAPFAAALERAEDAVVVWAPEEVVPQPRLQLPRVTAVIRRLYRREARFGNIEVWRRQGSME